MSLCNSGNVRIGSQVWHHMPVPNKFGRSGRCTAGRTDLITGRQPLRTGTIIPQLPGGPSHLGTPLLSKFLLDFGYNTGEFGKKHLGDHTDALPSPQGFREFWGYLNHLDAMQGVSFPTSIFELVCQPMIVVMGLPRETGSRTFIPA